MNKLRASFALFVAVLVVVIGLQQAAIADQPQGQAHFFVNVTITTHRQARVRVHWRTICTAGTTRESLHGHFIGLTPLETTLPVPIEQADWCHGAVWARNLDHPRGIPRVDVEVVS